MPIGFELGRLAVGRARPAIRVVATRSTDRSATRNGRCLRILGAEDQHPATHLERVRGWLDTVTQR